MRRLERIAGRAHLSDALLGALAALAADSPEITSSITALVHGQKDVGAGVVLGSAVFNITALMGLGSVVARGLPLRRRVVAFAGTVTMALTVLALTTVSAPVAPSATLPPAVLIIGSYLFLLGGGTTALGPLLRWRPTAGSARWIADAVEEEELAEEDVVPDMRSEIAAGPTLWGDLAFAGAALAVVIVASYAMERSVTDVGSRVGAPGIVVGALVLGAVTGIPNAVASIYLARVGKGTGALSAAMNSNNFNIVIGLMVPAVAVGIGGGGSGETLVAAWCLALTASTVIVGWRNGRLSRGFGAVVLGTYVAFAASVVATGLA